MDFYDALIKQATQVDIEPSETSYFSAHEGILDPRIFRDQRLISSVRSGILATLYGFLNQHFTSPESWTNVWLAGSGVSFQWSAHRDPGDLDCLIGINYPVFRQSNVYFKGLTDKEIAGMFNEILREKLWPLTENYLDSFELTFYVNVQADIIKIRPYAAYSLTADAWTVQPVGVASNIPKEWESKAEREHQMAFDIISKYQSALNNITAAKSQEARISAEFALKLAVAQGSALFEDIHTGRSQAFSEHGKGYSDYANYRWQYGKEIGVVQALKKLKDVESETRKEVETRLYGGELPNVATLIRRAASQYRNT